MKSSGSWLLLLSGVVAVILVGVWLTREEAVQQEAGGPPAFVLPVTLSSVERGGLEPHVELTGSVTSARRARLGFLTGGRIQSLDVRAGDVVDEGAVLGRLWDEDQQVQLTRARSSEQLVQRQLEKDLAGPRVEEIRRLEADLAARQADADLAQKEVDRNEGLVGTEIISMSRFDTLTAMRDAAVARVGVASEALGEARAGTRAEDLAIRRADLALRAAEVGIAQRELDKTLLKAPFGGHVVRRLAALGDMVAEGVPVFELVDLGLREIEVEIPSARASRLDALARVVVTLDDVPGFELETELDSLMAVADAESRNFRGLVRIRAEQDTEQVLKPGMFARLDLYLRPLRDVLLVPEDSLRETPAGTVVVVARSSPEGAGAPPGAGPGGMPALLAEWVPVRVLATDAGRAAVEVLDATEGGGLAPGDAVVLSGADLAFPGASLMVTSGAGPAAPGGAAPVEAAAEAEGQQP